MAAGPAAEPYGSEGAKFWLAVLTDLRNRGVNDVFFLIRDGLKNLPEVVGNVWRLTTTQTCIIHLIAKRSGLRRVGTGTGSSGT